MKKKTIKKYTKKKYAKRTNKKTNKKVYHKNKRYTNKKRNKTLKKNKKILKGGSDTSRLDGLLRNENGISWLPKSIIFELNEMKKYLSMISVEELNKIVSENKEWIKSPTILNIFNYSLEELEDTSKIILENNVDCESLITSQNKNLKDLFLLLLECNNGKFVLQDVNWINVVCGEKLDPSFEYECMKIILEKGISIDYEELKEVLEQLSGDLDFQIILLERLKDCSKTPRSFLDSITGSVSFPSYEECKKKNSDSVLFIYNAYKRFLTSYNDISKLDKIKILVFVETRIQLLSKYISLEVIRLDDMKYNDVRKILNNIYKNDLAIIRENDRKFLEFSKNKDKNVEDILNESQVDLTEDEKMLAELEQEAQMETDEIMDFKENIEQAGGRKIKKFRKQKGGNNPFETSEENNPFVTPKPEQNPFVTPQENNPFENNPIGDTVDGLIENEDEENAYNLVNKELDKNNADLYDPLQDEEDTEEITDDTDNPFEQVNQNIPSEEVDDDDDDDDEDDDDDNEENIPVENNEQELSKDNLNNKIDLYNNCTESKNRLRKTFKVTKEDIKNNNFDKCYNLLGIDLFEGL